MTSSAAGLKRLRTQFEKPKNPLQKERRRTEKRGWGGRGLDRRLRSVGLRAEIQCGSQGCVVDSMACLMAQRSHLSDYLLGVRGDGSPNKYSKVKVC